MWLTRNAEVDSEVIRDALAATAENRGTLAAMDGYREVTAQVASDARMLSPWSSYARRYPYVGDVALEETCGTVVEIMEAIGW